MTIIDTHVHVWESASEAFPWAPIGNLSPDFFWTTEQQVMAMEQSGIDKGVIVQTSWYGYDNRYGLDCLRRYPGRFAYVGMVDPLSETIEAEMEDLALKGAQGLRLAVRLRPDLPWYSSPQADRLWRKAAELDWVLCLLVGPEQAVEAAGTIERFPAVRVVIDHIARPDVETDPERPLFKKLLGMARLGNVFIKVSAFPAISREPYPHADVLERVREVHQAYGAQRMVWGSDHAMTQQIGSFPLTQALELLEMALAGVSDEERAWVRGGYCGASVAVRRLRGERKHRDIVD